MKIIAITPNKKQDYTTEMTVEGFQDLGYEIVASDLGNGITKSFFDKEILSTSDAEFVLAFFGKIRDNSPPKYYLLDNLRLRYKTAYIDGSEWTSTGYQLKNQIEESIKDPSKRRGFPWINEEMREKCNLYFKRESYADDVKSGIIPLPFCLTKRHLLDKVEKDIDVMCVFGQHNTGLRREVTQYCLQIKNTTRHKIVVANHVDKKDYKSLLARSRIVIDAWGGGDNCDRFYEAIGAQACCLYQSYNVVVENKFEDYKQAVSYSNIDSFAKNLELLLKSRQLTQEIGNNGLLHAKKYHSAKVRAKKIIEEMKKV